MKGMLTIIVAVLSANAANQPPGTAQRFTRTKTATFERMADCENVLTSGYYKKLIKEDEQLLEISCKLKREE
jgi:hypothetical protein